MRNVTGTTRYTTTPCRTAFCGRNFRSVLAILADTAFAVSAFVLLCLLPLDLLVLVNISILVIVPVLIVRLLGGIASSKRNRLIC